MGGEKLSRKEFIQVGLAGLLGLATTRCTYPYPISSEYAPIQTPVSEIPTPTVETVEKLERVANSLLLLPESVSQNNPQAIDQYLSQLVRKPVVDLELSIDYLNNPGMLPDNDEEPSLLTGQKEPGQSQAELALQPLAPEVRLISGGQFVLPLSDQVARQLPETQTVRESNSQGGINTHLVYQKVALYDGRPGVLIPGGKDPDQNVHTAEGNYNRGNILLVLPATEQGQTSLFAQVDTGANWQAQYRPNGMLQEQGGLTPELISYMLYNPDAQRSEGHGLGALESMYRGSNCQGQGCRTTNDQGVALAEMAGIGIYVVQINPKGHSVNLLSSTVIPDSELSSIFLK
jgi:hypothetical protein